MDLKPIEIGRLNTLKVLKRRDQGIYLGDDIEEILLPNKYVPDDIEIDDLIDVFVYIDSSDRPIATTLVPKAYRDEFAYLEVKQVTSVGAFLDLGLEKDLLVPFKEQQQRMEVGKYYLVYVYLDDITDRLVASSHINKFLAREISDLEEGQEVNVLIGEETEIGYLAIINGKYRGLIYKNQVFKKLYPGQVTTAYVNQIRSDLKVDLMLEPAGVINIEPNAKKIYDYLKSNDGFVGIHDKSDPDTIKEIFQMSKKNYKKAIGSLYKQRLVKIENKGIRLSDVKDKKQDNRK